MSGETRRAIIPGRAWPFLIVGLLGLNVLVCAITVVSALSSPYTIEPGYYEKAVAWDADRAAFPDPVTLGWRVSASARPGFVEVEIRDGEGSPVGARRVSGEWFHRASAGERATLSFTPMGEGRFVAPASSARAGQWELRLEIAGESSSARGVYTVRVD